MEKSGMSIAVEETLARVSSLITDETIVASNLREELRRLLSSLMAIRHVLRGAESEAEQKENVIIMHWFMNLKKVAYEADDLMDVLAYEILHPKVVTQLNYLQKLIFNAKSAHRVQSVRKLFRKLQNEAPRSSSRYIFENSNRGQDLVVDNPIFGREDDASKIVNLLTTHSSSQQLLTVVPIVGIDGLGKTSLAKLVCRQVMTLNLFRVNLWVCVSEKYDERNFWAQMLRSLNATLTTKDPPTLQQLEKELARKKFLLVLDDVCEDVSTWWGDFITWLLKICSNNGNVVLVTTCSEQVASIVETSSHHRHTLDFLSDDECWFILKNRAFGNVIEQVHPRLETIGSVIARKCRGVPLAAKVLGGTLGFNRKERAWLELSNSHLLEEMDIEKSLLSTLQLNFLTLPSSLDSCFAFCSIFPKEFLIVKEDLIQMWMAESFAASCDMGNKYFHTLLATSFFQDTEIDDDGNVIKCRMHNLVHDLALSLEKPDMRIHFLYVDDQFIRTAKALPMDKAKYLSTIILNGGSFQSSWNSKRLRTLYLNDVDMEYLPLSISKLKHFKYLHISNTKTRPLPKSITEIYMLQILTLSNCSCEQLPFLGDLPHLKFLKISHMERVKYIGNESYEGNNIRHVLTPFPALKSLSLSWMKNLTEWCSPSHRNDVVIFRHLENLSIQCCPKLTGFPMRDMSALVKIEMKDCEELRFIFDVHKSFPSVTSLSIVGCPKLAYLRNWLLSNESYKEFRIRRCEWLMFIPDDLGMQRSLVSLQIYCCKGLRFFSEEILCKLTQLRKLTIGAFSEKLDDFCYLNRMKDLKHLKELELWGSDVFGRKMSSLPNQLQHLASLQSLKIKGFTTMEALPEWFANLQSLKAISLNYCWHLEYQSTTAIIQQLSNLSHVYVSNCRALEIINPNGWSFQFAYVSDYSLDIVAETGYEAFASEK